MLPCGFGWDVIILPTCVSYWTRCVQTGEGARAREARAFVSYLQQDLGRSYLFCLPLREDFEAVARLESATTG